MEQPIASLRNPYTDKAPGVDAFSLWTAGGPEHQVLTSVLEEVVCLFWNSTATAAAAPLQTSQKPRSIQKEPTWSIYPDYETSNKADRQLENRTTTEFKQDIPALAPSNTEVDSFDAPATHNQSHHIISETACETQQANPIREELDDESEDEERGFFTDYGYFTHEPHDAIPAVLDAEDQQFSRHRRCLHLRRRVQCPDIHFNCDYLTTYGNAKGNVDRWDNRVQERDFAKKSVRMWPWENADDVYGYCDSEEMEKSGGKKRTSSELARTDTHDLDRSGDRSDKKPRM